MCVVMGSHPRQEPLFGVSLLGSQDLILSWLSMKTVHEVLSVLAAAGVGQPCISFAVKLTGSVLTVSSEFGLPEPSPTLFHLLGQ